MKQTPTEYIKSEHNRLKELPKFMVRGHSAINKVSKIRIPSDTYVIFFAKSGRVSVTINEKYTNLFNLFSKKQELNTLVSDILINKSKYNDLGFDVKYPGDEINEQTLHYIKRSNRNVALLRKIKLPINSKMEAFHTCGKKSNTSAELLSEIIKTPGVYFIGTCRSVGQPKHHFNVISNISIDAVKRHRNREVMGMVYNKKNHSLSKSNVTNRQLFQRYEVGQHKYLPETKIKKLKKKIVIMYRHYAILKSYAREAKKNPVIDLKALKQHYINQSILIANEETDLKEAHSKLVQNFSTGLLSWYISFHFYKYGIDLYETHQIMQSITKSNIHLIGNQTKRNQNDIRHIKQNVRQLQKKNFLDEKDVNLVKRYSTVLNGLFNKIHKCIKRSRFEKANNN